MTTISFDGVDEQYRESLRLCQKKVGKALWIAFFRVVEDENDRKEWYLPVKTRVVSRSFKKRSVKKAALASLVAELLN